MPASTVRSNVARVVQEYHEQVLRYHDFCTAVRNLIVSLLEHRRFKYQISSRIKSLDSVREKIARNAPRGKFYQELADVEDLAGIRVVFYLESDKRRFLSALTREMTRSKLQMEEHRKDRGYRATHVLVQLGRKRLALNEYRRFAGLKCEVQLTSALYNAWAEVEHDILYKRCPSSTPLDRATFSRLREDLDMAMEVHLQAASDIIETAARRADAAATTRTVADRGRRHARGGTGRR